MYLKRKNEIYIPTFVDVMELEEGSLKERKIDVTVRDVVSTKMVKKIEAPASTGIKKG